MGDARARSLGAARAEARGCAGGAGPARSRDGARPARVPTAALGPVALVVLVALAWSSSGGAAARGRGASGNVVERAYGYGRARTPGVEPAPAPARSSRISDRGTPLPAPLEPASASALDDDDRGRGAFRPFERRRGSGRPPRPPPRPAPAAIERVRQRIDDSHLPSLPPAPPAAPRPPPEPPEPGVDDDGDGGGGGGRSGATATTRRVRRERKILPRPRPVRVEREDVERRESARWAMRAGDENAAAGAASSPEKTPTTSPRVVSDADATASPKETPPSRVAFYLQMSNEPKASLEVVKAVREHFPDAPLFVSSDGDSGWDCSSMCAQYLCDFTREPSAAGMHGAGGVAEWLARLQRAASNAPGAEFLVLLEDDVRVDGAITRWPTSDAGGVEDFRWTAPMSDELLAELERRSGAKPSYEHYGLCGGAIVAVAALAEIRLEDAEAFAEEVAALGRLDDRVGRWNDVTLAALLMARGRTVAPWADLKQGAHPLGKTAMTHNDKRWYGKPLAEDERGMCAPPASNAGG